MTKPKPSQTLSWQDRSETQTAGWQSESGQPPPKNVVIVDDTTTADAAYWRACAGTAVLYQGDFQNAKQLLQAITRRVDRQAVKPVLTLLEAFHQLRSRQIGRANIVNKVLIELVDGKCPLNRAPDLQQAVEHALGETALPRLVLSLREALGMIGADEWRKKGVYISALKANIHADYGVYSPNRGEYLDLIHQASFQQASADSPNVAWDVGTGTGVIAAILVARGVSHVTAIDISPRALQCAARNFQRLNMQDNTSLAEKNLFPEGKADLIVCNPPWVPAKANTPIDQAIYDPKSRMLKSFLNGVGSRLNENGQAWLVISNLAEHIGLRGANDLLNWIQQSGLKVEEKLDTSPVHAKAMDQSDPLYEARSKEVTSLYQLIAA
ncbi:methyltransferase [Fuerstiella marisgermanici]|uniref:N5-glutamine S-adenosyl-L-methionine-dependent methyltransferase n=1 Tax=Fuerstiella marisgermanici TaxID=1891926 RepID=A0A1P8WFC2_9PLAN|nr:class I SAM-dependent methyltransferase [Fuerstiella marisgermanici]APZ92746.1 N5-glutamine S-adenosyl-L-methionine-dependent methyltransferase [Fuerstiella marisgermanici]